MSGTRKQEIVYAKYPSEYVHPLLSLKWYYSHPIMSIAMKCGRCVKPNRSSYYVTETRNLRLDAFCHICGWCPATDGLENIPTEMESN